MSERCQGTNARGEPCGSPAVDGGWCQVHRPGNENWAREIGAKGGHALREKMASPGFSLDDLPEIRTLEDAKQRLDAIQRAILTRQVTHHEGNAACRAVAEWVKVESVAITQRLVVELEKELQEKTAEINALKSQLAGRRAVKAVS